MLFVIRFTDNPQRLHIREKFKPDHLAWLAERRTSILVAGSLREEPAASPSGAIWIVEAESKAAAEALYLSDPFWSQGLRQGVEVWHWIKAFPDQKVLV